MPQHKTIHEAMLAVQLELTNPIKSATNSHFKSKYAPLPDMRDMITPILAKHGLYCIQPVQIGDMGAYLETNIIFAPTGDKVFSNMPLMLDKQTAQGMGSALTYARRYALALSSTLWLTMTTMSMLPANQSPRLPVMMLLIFGQFRNRKNGLKSYL